jgi:glyoxylase-like metal-dependent hydrolase (beta-lactamase superfamily II)
MKNLMNADIYKFNVGTFECYAIRDWLATYENPATLLFFKAPKVRLKQILRENGIEITSWQEWLSPYTCLFVQTESHKVLIDTGIGSIWAPDYGHLTQLLDSMAVKSNEIDVVLITHAHGDHCGGNTDAKGRPAFPNARYIMMQNEWDFWISEETLTQPQYEWMSLVVEKSMKPLQDHFELIKKSTEIVPGVVAIDASGHTPGHIVVRISSGEEQLWYMSDAFLHPLHIEHPDWSAEVDVEPDQAAMTRYSLLNQVVDGRQLIHCFHFSFPGLGHIVRSGEGYRWRPLSFDGSGYE